MENDITDKQVVRYERRICLSDGSWTDWAQCSRDYHPRPGVEVRALGVIATMQQQSGPSDAQMLDWLERQDMNELTFGMFHDQPHDGEYCIHPGDAPYYGRTLRDAIRAAMQAKGEA